MSLRSRSASTGRFDPWLIAAALLAVLPILAILRPGMPNTADGQVHLLRTLEVSHLLRAGVLYPRWAPDFYLGYGYPFFNFYAPGAHLLAGLAALGGLGVVRGVVAAQVLALLLYPTGAYLAARTIFAAPRLAAAARPAALISAALYLHAPLRWRELFIQGNLSQLLALAWLPWCAWLLTEAVQRRSARWAVAAGLALAGLVYAHHPSAFLAYPLLAVYAVVLAVVAGGGWRSRRSRGGLGAVVGAFLLGAATSAVFWLPWLVELRDVNITAIEAGMFNAARNLTPLAELLARTPLLDEAALNPPMPNNLGVAQVALALSGLAAALAWVWPRRSRDAAAAGRTTAGPADTWTRRQAGAALLAVAVLLGICLGWMLPVAAPIWERLPLARFIAFPWRLLGPALLWAALLGGAALHLVPARFRTAALTVLLSLIVASAAPYLFPRPFAPVAEPVLADIIRYELAGGARGTASANEYLPRWVHDSDPAPVLADDYLAGRPPDRLDRDALPSGSRAIPLTQAPLEDRYRLDLPAAANARIRRFYFPGWRAWVDGRPVSITPGAGDGLIEVAVPAGLHELRVRFGSTPAATAGGGLAAVGVAGALWALWRGRRTSDSSGIERGAAGWRPLLVAVVTIAILTGVKVLLVEPHTRWFRLQSDVAAPAGMTYTLHARFANGIELIGYDVGDAAPRQGDALAVRLYWRPLEPQAADVRPFLHLDALTGEVTWANQTRLHAGDKPSTDWPVGFYVVDDYRLEIPAETPAVVARLRVGLLGGDDQVIPLADGGDLATLTTVRVRERRPLTVQGLPGSEQPYRLGPDVTLTGHAVTVTETPPVLVVTLYWQTAAALSADYTVFVHVLDAAGQAVAYGDGPPLGGWYPSSAWAAGQVVLDIRRVPLPAGVDPARLRVAVGLYTAADGARLPVTDAHGTPQADDQIVLTPAAR